VKPLPQCLKTKDHRGTIAGDTVAPYGTAKIPASGNLCQSCHISRNLAAGSILFRPFRSNGLIVKASSLDGSDPEVIEATKPGHVTQTGRDGEKVQVDLDTLRGLLNWADGTEEACWSGPGPDDGEVLQSVKSLAEKVASSDRLLAKGLARIVPRALSNLESTSFEVQNTTIESYEKNGGKLQAIFENYFSTETYACSKIE
jgi:hypothetical protein